MRILHAVTVPVTAKSFLFGQLRDLADHGENVHLLCAPGQELADVDPRVTVHPVEMSRDPDPLRDLVTLLRLTRLLRRLRPDVTVVGTPKAGLLVGVAAVISGVPRRYYLLRGLRLEGSHGPQRALLTVLEVVACRAAHRVVAVSPSLAARAARLPGVGRRRVVVAGPGSSNGVDAERFKPARPDERLAQRRRAGLRTDTVVFGFVGRLSPDKGMAELAAAASTLRARADIQFLVVGEVEGRREAGLRTRFAELGVTTTGLVADSAAWYAAIDVLVLPTYREGFPNVVLEAAASGIPAITTSATGARDSVVDGVTGLLVPPRDAAALAQAVRALADDPGRRTRLGAAARRRALDDFDQALVWRRYHEIWRS